jgi:putative transposase
MTACQQLAPEVGTAAACRSMEVSRATFYRRLCRAEQLEVDAQPRPKPVRALSDEERGKVVEILHQERFMDKAPATVYATLLDEGTYLCSTRTMYRILGEEGEVRERRDQLRHPHYSAPQLLATGPNQVWSWDITKLLGPVKWSHFYLFVILDLFSRYVVGWMIADRESAVLAERLIRETCEKQNIEPGQLTIHADRGSSMTSKPVALLMADLGITKTHSRPHVSDDNPYSESQFKTLKYHPTFPERFGSIEDARAFCQRFFPWYNTEHRHSGIGLLTPATVHYGNDAIVTHQRQLVLTAAFSNHPERFVRGAPQPPRVPDAVWINKPKPASTSTEILAPLPDHTPNHGVFEFGPERDRRSWGFLEADFFNPVPQVTGNERKFVEQVSQSR